MPSKLLGCSFKHQSPARQPVVEVIPAIPEIKEDKPVERWGALAFRGALPKWF